MPHDPRDQLHRITKTRSLLSNFGFYSTLSAFRGLKEHLLRTSCGRRVTESEGLVNIFYVAKSIFCKTCSSWIFLQQLLNNFLTCKPSVHNTHYVLVKSLEFQSISELGIHHIFCLCQLQCSPTSSSQSHAMALAPLQLFRSYSAFDAKKPKKKRAKGWKGIKIGEKSAIFLLTPL